MFFIKNKKAKDCLKKFDMLNIEKHASIYDYFCDILKLSRNQSEYYGNINIILENVLKNDLFIIPKMNIRHLIFDKGHYFYFILAIRVIDNDLMKLLNDKKNNEFYFFEDEKKAAMQNTKNGFVLIFKLSMDSSHERGNLYFVENKLKINYEKMLKETGCE